MSAEFRGTRYYVAWGVAERGPLFRLCSLFARVYEHIGHTDWAKETVEAALASHLPVGLS
jgi:hypothetical protein